jgi:hypothetical protein
MMNVDNKPKKRRDAAGLLAARRHQNEDSDLGSVAKKRKYSFDRSGNEDGSDGEMVG